MEITSIEPLKIRQIPGNKNHLGKIKFVFENKFDIYLHDTPTKDVFNETNRAFSHGCIRVKNPRELVMYLNNNTRWSAKKIDSLLLVNNKQVDIDINPTMPIYINYFTAWIDQLGQLNFRDDLYNLDVE